MGPCFTLDGVTTIIPRFFPLEGGVITIKVLDLEIGGSVWSIYRGRQKEGLPREKMTTETREKPAHDFTFNRVTPVTLGFLPKQWCLLAVEVSDAEILRCPWGVCKYIDCKLSYTSKAYCGSSTYL